MICVGERVKRAIDEMNRGEFLFALEQVSIAIDITAKKYYEATSSNADNYKKILREYSWLIELMSFPGINLEGSKFGNFSFKDSRGKNYPEPTFQDIMYHVVRCSLVHGDTPDQPIKLHHEDTIFLSKDTLILPIRLIFGLLGIIVFCKANKNEITAHSYFLSIYEQKFTINAWWGMEEFIHALNQENIKSNPRISLVIPYGHFKLAPISHGTEAK